LSPCECFFVCSAAYEIVSFTLWTIKCVMVPLHNISPDNVCTLKRLFSYDRSYCMCIAFSLVCEVSGTGNLISFHCFKGWVHITVLYVKFDEVML